MEIFRQETHHWMMLHVHCFLFVTVAVHLICAVNQYDSEDQQHPIKALNDSSTGKNKHETQDNCPQNTPIEHMLIFCILYAERGKYHHHDEEIIHR